MVAIITGASRGIGRACAKKFALEGFKVVANYNNSKAQAEDLKAELADVGVDIDIFKADVSKRNEVKAMVDFALEKYGRIDVVVNNVRYCTGKAFY